MNQRHDLPPLCNCNCGQYVKKNKCTKRWNRFAWSHHRRGAKMSPEAIKKIRKFWEVNRTDNSLILVTLTNEGKTATAIEKETGINRSTLRRRLNALHESKHLRRGGGNNKEQSTGKQPWLYFKLDSEKPES